MIIGKILRKTINKPEEDTGSGCIIPVFIAIIIATIVLKIFSYAAPEKTVSLLTAAEGMQQLVHTEDISKYTSAEAFIPSQTIESQLYVIGVYTENGESFPKDSIALVYVKDNERLFEVDELANSKLSEHSRNYPKAALQEIKLSEETVGYLVNLKTGFDCTNPIEGSHPKMCQLTDVLMFEKNGLLIKIYSDGKKLTDGELIEIAKSI